MHREIQYNISKPMSEELSVATFRRLANNMMPYVSHNDVDYVNHL